MSTACHAPVSAVIVIPGETQSGAEGAPLAEPAVVVEAPGASLEDGGEREDGGTEEDLVGALLAILEEKTTSAWDEAVAQILLARYDVDGSGEIDSESELAGISCAVYRTLDEAVLEARESELMVTYGFDSEYMWVGDALGFDEALRSRITAAMRACGLTA